MRKNAHTGPIAKEFQRRGIPYEIVGINGLLDVPEVADMVAIATMLIRPTDSAAALRILGGPAVGLGVRDIQALARRAGGALWSGQQREDHGFCGPGRQVGGGNR